MVASLTTIAAAAATAIVLLCHEVNATPSPMQYPQSTIAFVTPGGRPSSRLSTSLFLARHKLLKQKKVVSFADNIGQHPASSSFAHSNRRHQRRNTHLHTTIDNTNNGNNLQQQLQTETIIARLDLHDQFSRWKFLQRLLEAELSPSDIEDVLLASLSAYLSHGPTPSSSNNKNENGGEASPVLTDEQKRRVKGLLHDMMGASDGIGTSKFLHMLVLPPVDYESTVIDVDGEGDREGDDGMVEVDSNALSILQQLESILPDPIEDEEAYKSAWDVVIDLYGRESVRVREEALQRERESSGSGNSDGVCHAENLQWRTLCAIGRVLIHFDFLTKGVLKEGTFR